MAIIDRIKHDASSEDLLVWKFPSEELALGSQLIVSQSQEALFVKRGQALDVFGPGTHTLSTGNLPILNNIINLPFGGKTPFTAEIWFVNKTIKRNLKWGTPSPIPILDPRFNYFINVRAFGMWGIRIDDSKTFVNQIVGTMQKADNDMVVDYFIGEINQKLSNSLVNMFTSKNISIVEINGHLNELSKIVLAEIVPEFLRFGIEIISFNIERINIPEDDQKKIQEVMGKRMEMEQLGQVVVGQGYMTAKTFEVLNNAATNEGAAGAMMAGAMGAGLGLGVGLPISQQVGANITNSQNNIKGSSPLPQANNEDPGSRLAKLKSMLDAGLITAQDFETKKKEILSSI